MVKQAKSIPLVIGTDGLALAPLTAFDFFCGGGGASLGLHRAGIDMLAALNHSDVAIATHLANFPGTRHLLCDIRKQKSWGLGHADIMWASPDCTHHSIAKGGQSRDAKERALAEELPRFAYNLNVNCIMVENVKEFLDWGPLEIKRDQHGRAILDKKGEEQWVAIKSRKKEYYNAWVKTLAELGFVNYEYRKLNSADFGAPQSRVRYFGIFTRKGVAIEWPTPTHDKLGQYGRTKWVAVRGVLDLEDKGRSIFTEWDRGTGRKSGDQPADKTLRRILAGLRKHVIGAGGREFLDKRSSNPASGKPGTGASTHTPGPTVATCYLPDLVTPAFIYKNQSNPPSGKPAVGASIDRPSDVITASWHPGLISPQFLCNPAWGGASRSVNHCAPVVVARLTIPLNGQAPTLNTNGGNLYLMSYYGNGSTNPVCNPCFTLRTHDCAALLGFVTSSGYHQRAYSWSRPATPIVASRRHQYLVLARPGSPVAVQPGDSVTMRLLKAVCRKHGIADIYMRMLKVDELKEIMGFPSDYYLAGSATKQKEMLGNAVVPQVSEAIARAMTPSLQAARLQTLPRLRVQAINRYEQGSMFTARPDTA